MLNRYARAFFTNVFTPIARMLLRMGISPDVVTLVGTLGVCAGALIFFPMGELFIGVMVITAFVFSDTIDGIMARMRGGSSSWGAFLDSTLDRAGDGAVFAGLAIWYFQGGDDRLTAWLALLCLVLGSLVSYARARAEGLGMRADVGIAERADRLVSTLVTAGLVGLGLPQVFLTVVLGLLAAASLVTVIQRILLVRRQALAAEGAPPPITPVAAPAATSTARRPRPQRPRPGRDSARRGPRRRAASDAGRR
ncbi:CDP-alcohol phosphatidyltransferase family protein [Janibacter alkaliphilus]|uniref:Phosphatidylinositol phosphate synthase n=1 Tax=Janibacter alkaliphilus TaxID=1069963 RepID=A0A852XC50_9MICO|nr:CDP-diacylglycerol--glycerol-3-phosphate 3-phosphatidyltransferase [Janibacter alkaliphilus]